MKTEVEKIEEGLVRLTVEVPASDLESDLKQAYRQIAGQIRIPGFRKGKIPAAIIDQRVGKEVVLEEMAQIAIPRLYRSALKEADVKPVGMPDIEIDKPQAGEPLTFKAKVPVRPKPQLGQYKALEVEIPERTVTDKEVDDRLAVLQDRFSELIPKADPAEAGDYVLCDYTVSLGGEKLDELAVSDYMIKVGAEDVAPEFTEAVNLHKAEETVNFKLKMPADHPNEKIRGAEVDIELTIKEVKQIQRPGLSDEFAKQVSEFDSIGELREDIRSKLQSRRDEEVDTELKRQVAKAAVANTTLSVPQSMIESEVDMMIHRFGEPLEREGMKLEDYLTQSGITRESLEKQFWPSAKDRVEQEIVLEEIAEAEGITVSDDEVEAEIARIAADQRRDAAKLRSDLEEADRMDDVKDNLRLLKALDLIVAEANPREISREEYLKRLAEQESVADVAQAAARAAGAAPAGAEG